MDKTFITCHKCKIVIEDHEHVLHCRCSVYCLDDPDEFPECWEMSLAALTPSQYEVYKLLAEGKSPLQISEETNRSRKTIKQHMMWGRRRVKAATTYELVARIAVAEFRSSHESRKSAMIRVRAKHARYIRTRYIRYREL